MTKSFWLVVGVGSVCIMAIMGLLFLLDNRKPYHQRSLPVAAKQVSVEKTLTTNMLYVGEVFWGRGIEYHAQHSALGYSFPFSGLNAADKQDFNAWIGDMECPITNKDIPYQTQVDSLLFNCRPEYVPEAAKWFDALTLANNHTNNNGGVWGIEQTRKNLEGKIQYFGDYDMHNTANICDVIAMPASLATTGQDVQKVTIPLALCGYDYVGNVQPRQAEYDVMKQYAKVMPVIAMPHMGVEYRPTAEEAKITTYHALIDNGADVVIGAHPHVVQNSENYKGRLIVYSTGNFMFDQQSLGKDTIESLGVALKLTINDASAIGAYTSLQNCNALHDDCLTQLTTKLTKRPTVTVSYDNRCFDQSSNIPRKASLALCDEILKRATWKDATTGLASQW